MKRYLVTTAILAAVVLIGLVSSCFAQNDRPGTVDPAPDQATDQRATGSPSGYIPAPDQAKETTATTAVEPKVEIREGPRGPQGPRGASGTTIVRTHTREVQTRVAESHRGHQGAYREVKSWNPASVSYVDAKIAKASRGNAAASEQENNDRGAVAPAPTPTPAIAPVRGQPMHNDWTWLLIGLLLLALLALMIRRWLPIGRVITNTANFYHHGRNIGSSTASVRLTAAASRQVGVKEVRNISASESTFRAQTRGRDLPGEEFEFRLRFLNNSGSSVPGDSAWVADTLDENYEFVPGSGRAYINRRYIGEGANRADRAVAVPDWMMNQILYDGRVLRMNQIAGLPADLRANSSFYLVFRVRVNDGEDEEDDDEGLDFVDAAAEGGPEYADQEEPDNDVAAALNAAAGV